MGGDREQDVDDRLTDRQVGSITGQGVHYDGGRGHEVEPPRAKDLHVPLRGLELSRPAGEHAPGSDGIGDRRESAADPVGVLGEEDGQRDAQGRGEADHGESGRGGAPRPDDGDDGRPRDVELFLHCERPQVPDPPLPIRSEVDRVRARHQEAACRDVDQAGHREPHDDGEEDVERREDAKRPSEVEEAKRDVPRPLPLAQHQGRDQEAGDHEERPHAEIRQVPRRVGGALAQEMARSAEVAVEHERDGDGAQAVERRDAGRLDGPHGA
ncbi:MAG: hypothetical protein U0167_15040 [bacterium]